MNVEIGVEMGVDEIGVEIGTGVVFVFDLFE
jgi:hypothetical protein